jgi:steroid delta-isomerase-like uncharacterized protein
MGASRQVVEQVYAALAAHDLHALNTLCAPTCELTEPGVHMRGPEQIAGYLQTFITAFPDVKIEPQTMLEVDDMVAAEIRFTGTHTGPLAGPGGELPPTGRRVDLPGADFLTVSNGQVTAWRVYYDAGTLMAQLGLSPAPPQGAPV